MRRGLFLNYATIGYNSLEAIVSLVAGFMTGSVALVGFGIDSVVELSASAAAQWRLRADIDAGRRQRVERATLRIIGWSFMALAAYVSFESMKSLAFRERPDPSLVGIGILALSVIVMPLLARAKRHIARALGSRALEADARQTSLCTYLSMIALVGVAVNAVAGWWWADPLAALGMVPIIVREGREALRGDACGDEQATSIFQEPTG